MAFPRLLRVISQSIYSHSSSFSTSQAKATEVLCEKKEVIVTFISGYGDERRAKGKVGSSLYDVMIDNGIAFHTYDKSEVIKFCPACSICHMTFTKDDYEKLPTKPTVNELYILDLVYKRTETSRLGCVVKLTEDMDGLVVEVPHFFAPLKTFTSCAISILAYFKPSLRDSCRKCLDFKNNT